MSRPDPLRTRSEVVAFTSVLTRKLWEQLLHLRDGGADRGLVFLGSDYLASLSTFMLFSALFCSA